MTINKEIENTKKKQMELKNSTAEIKNMLERIKRRLEDPQQTSSSMVKNGDLFP